MKIKALIICVLLLNTTSIFSQMEGVNWLFGNGCGLYFDLQNNTTEKFFTTFNSLEGCSSISDKNGKLILGCDAQTAYCYENRVSKSEMSVNGNSSSLQATQILKLPNSNNQYLLLNAGDSAKAVSFLQPHYFSYSIIEKNDAYCMNFIVKDKQLQTNVGEGLCSYFNKKDSSYLIVTTNYPGNLVYIYKCDRKGKISLLRTHNTNRVVNYDSGFFRCIKFSPDGNYIAISFYSDVYLLLYNVNLDDGTFSNEMVINNFLGSSNIYSLEFSANSNMLYCTPNVGTYKLIQFDLTSNTAGGINGTCFGVAKQNCAGIQLAPNNKIYVLDNNVITLPSKATTDLHVIEKPNESGPNCNFIPNAISYNVPNNSFGLPNMVTSNYFVQFKANITSNSPICFKDSIRLFSTFDVDTSLVDCAWTGPNGFQSKEKNPVIYYNSINQNGTYSLTSILKTNNDVSVVKTVVNNHPELKVNISLNKTKNLCEGDTLILTSNLNNGNYWYLDNFITILDSSKIIKVTKSNLIRLKNIDVNGCIAFDSVQVNFFPKAKPEIVSLSSCDNDSVQLYIKDKITGFDYYWRFKNQDFYQDTLYVKEIGLYKLFAKNKSYNLCEDSTEIDLQIQLQEKIKIIGQNTFCEGDSVLLKLSKNYSNVQFKWSNGEIANSIYVTKAGNYWCDAINRACLITDTINIISNPKPTFNIIGNTSICENQLTTLSANKDFLKYKWSTGDTTKSIVTNKRLNFTLEVTDTNGCKAVDSVVVNGVDAFLDVSQTELDFGEIEINQTDSKDIILKNNSTFQFKIEKLNGNKIDTIINPNQSFVYNYKLNLIYLKQFTDTVFFEITEPCNATISIPVKAEPYALAKISTDMITTKPDVNVVTNISLYKFINNNYNFIDTCNLNMNFEIHKNIFLPNDNFTTFNKKNIINFTSKFNSNPKDTLLGTISGQALFVDLISSPIELSKVVLSNKRWKIETKNGELKIGGICAIMIRGIQFTDDTLQVLTKTNQLAFNLSGSYKANVKVRLFNIVGQLLAENESNKIGQSISLEFDKIVNKQVLYEITLDGTPYKSGGLILWE